MNKIVINDLIFDDSETSDGTLLNGSFYVENSLLEDELGVDTLKFDVRFHPKGKADDILTQLPYGTSAIYYQGDQVFGTYYLVKVERLSQYGYHFEFQSAIGLLDDAMDYGGVYNGGISVAMAIAKIVDGAFPYSILPYFFHVQLYGWLPVAKKRDNLKQILFACGGSVQKNSNGDIDFTILENLPATKIPDSRVLEGGKLSYEGQITQVDVTEHGYTQSGNLPSEELYKGEIKGQSFTTPKGFKVDNAALITWNEPHYHLTYQNCECVNAEADDNYAIVSASSNAVIMGKPYLHTETIIHRSLPNPLGQQKIAAVKDATLVSLVNSASTAERVLSYYGNSNTLTASIVLDGEKPGDVIEVSNTFGSKSKGFIKSISGDFGNHIESGETEVIVNYEPPYVPGARVVKSLEIVKEPDKTLYGYGESFDPTGMIVEATFEDGSTRQVEDIVFAPLGPMYQNTTISIYYTRDNNTVSTSLEVYVLKKITNITINQLPNQLTYNRGDYVNLNGISVSVWFNDGTFHYPEPSELTYTKYIPYDAPYGPYAFHISYSDPYHMSIGMAEASFVINIGGDIFNPIKRIKIIKPPVKTNYLVGELFDPTGMVLQGTLSNDETITITDGFTWAPPAIQSYDTSVDILYNYGKSVFTKLPINVIYFSDFKILTPPNKTSYYDGDRFDPRGMTFQAVYSDGTTKDVSFNECSYDPEVLTNTTTEVSITYYSYGGLVVKQPVEVKYYPYDFTKSKLIETNGDYTLDSIGATHRNVRIVLIGGGQGGSSGGKGHKGEGWAGKPDNAGKGGLAGYGGEGGKVQIENLILNQNDKMTFKFQKGGAGGICNKDTFEPTAGNAGLPTLLTIGSKTYSSDNGTSLGKGYTDILTGEVYATPGEEGFPGGDAGSMIDGSISPDTMTYVSGDKGRNTSKTEFGQAFGGQGGGPAVGNDGNNGGDASYNKSNTTGLVGVLGGYGGKGGNGVRYNWRDEGRGTGGAGGFGGGGGGNGGSVTQEDMHSYPGEGGEGGLGSQGFDGCTGCAIIYYS